MNITKRSGVGSDTSQQCLGTPADSSSLTESPTFRIDHVPVLKAQLAHAIRQPRVPAEYEPANHERPCTEVATPGVFMAGLGLTRGDKHYYSGKICGNDLVVKHYAQPSAIAKIAPRFAEQLNAAKITLPERHSLLLRGRSTDEITGMKSVFLVKHWLAGCAVKPDGEIVSLFNAKKGLAPKIRDASKSTRNKNRTIVNVAASPTLGQHLVKTAVQYGNGKKLACYGDFLRDYYRKADFIPVASCPWTSLPPDNAARKAWPFREEPTVHYLVHKDHLPSAEVKAIAANGPVEARSLAYWKNA